MNVRIEQGDCIEVMANLQKEGVLADAIFVDPPYHLISIVKRFGGESAKAAKSNGATGRYARESKGFNGKTWDGGDIAFRPETWAAALALLKPGGYMIAFSHSTTYHRMAVAIEDAGFEIRDMIDWVYGQGTPKSKNLTGKFDGYGSALKPAKEPAVLARKPLAEGSLQANMEAYGVGALHIDALRVPVGSDPTAQGRWPANFTHDGSDEVLAEFPEDAGAKSPVTGSEPSPMTANIFGAMSNARPASKPFDERGNAARFFYCAKAPSQQRVYRCKACGARNNVVLDKCGPCGADLKADGGLGYDNHPTVKPLEMVEYWVQGICPPGGTVLDLFAGTGTTGIAALQTGRNAILIDNDPESILDIKFRIGLLQGADTPLFGGI